MSNKIFGYDWEDIQCAQQKRGRLQRTVDVSRPVDHAVTDADRKLLEEHGSIDALKVAGFHGTVDRLTRSGLTS